MNIRCAGDGYYRTAGASGGPISLYIHVPFCVRKCRYCDFLSAPAGEEERQRYLDELDREICSKSAWLQRILCVKKDRGSPRKQGAAGPAKEEAGEIRGQGIAQSQEAPAGGSGDHRIVPLRTLPEVDTIYIGGGTPSLLTPRQMDHLMFMLSSNFLIDEDAEITMECNPGTADEEKLRAFHDCGVNRLSIGVQSFRDEELRLLGRIHTVQEARDCVDAARRAGFENLNLDLMSALPGQSYEQWMENLSAAVEMEPEHISAYSLILEEGTPLREAQEKGLLPALPDEDTDRQMYHDTKTFLAQHGYLRYEISNYARPGFESRHNNGYWTGHPYLGLGLGASSYLILPKGSADFLSQDPYAGWDEPYGMDPEDLIFGAGSKRRKARSLQRIRFCSPEMMEDYLNMGHETFDILRKAEFLTRRDQMAEFMFLGLRRMKGVSERDFAAEFGKTMEEVYGSVLGRYCALGMLERGGGYMRLTDPGIDVSNTIMADFL